MTLWWVFSTFLSVQLEPFAGALKEPPQIASQDPWTPLHNRVWKWAKKIDHEVIFMRIWGRGRSKICRASGEIKNRIILWTTAKRTDEMSGKNTNSIVSGKRAKLFSFRPSICDIGKIFNLAKNWFNIVLDPYFFLLRLPTFVGRITFPLFRGWWERWWCPFRFVSFCSEHCWGLRIFCFKLDDDDKKWKGDISARSFVGLRIKT